jgi:hypothetical protein
MDMESEMDDGDMRPEGSDPGARIIFVLLSTQSGKRGSAQNRG